MTPYVINSDHGKAVYDLISVSNHLAEELRVATSSCAAMAACMAAEAGRSGAAAKGRSSQRRTKPKCIRKTRGAQQLGRRGGAATDEARLDSNSEVTHLV